MIDERLRLDAQEQRIAEFCRVDPRTNAFKDLHPPPSDHCRENGLAWGKWVAYQQWLREIRGSDRKADKEALAATDCAWIVERPGFEHPIELHLDDGEPDDRVWVWWDPVAGGTLIGVDRYGNLARAVREQDMDEEGM